MGLSMASLVGTILVLKAHHQNEKKPVPQWIRKAMRMRKSAVGERKETNEATRSEFLHPLDTKQTADERKVRSKPDDADQQQTEILRNILAALVALGSGQEKVVPGSNEWKELALALDKLFFFASLFLVLVNNIAFMIVISY